MVNRLLRRLGLTPAAEPEAPLTVEAAPQEPAAPLVRRLLMVVHNPPLEAEGGRRLTEAFGWNDPDALAGQ